MGGGVEIVNFFSIDCERSTVHIYISARGFCVEKTVFLFFQGFCFAHLPKDFFFGYQETTGYSSSDFFLSSYLPFFSCIFSSTFKRHFLPPFFVLPSFFGILIFRPFPYSSSYRMFLMVFWSYLLVVLIHSFLFIRLILIFYFSFPIFFQFVVVYFFYPSILLLGLQDAGKEQQGTSTKRRARNKSGSNVLVARLTDTPNTEPRLRGVDRLYRGERVATSTQNVRERNIGGQ